MALTTNTATWSWRAAWRLMLRWAVPLAGLIVALRQLQEDARIYPAWLGWSDQAHYLDSARAWAALNFDPAQHHFPSGYAWMAAPFVLLGPGNPFLIPDLLLTLVTLLLFVRICRRLAPDLPHADAAASLCFVVATVPSQRAADLWAEPWNTTAVAPFLLFCLLTTLKFAETPRRGLLRALGLAAGLGAFVRPSDALLVFGACGCYCGIISLRTRGLRRALVADAAHMLGGFIVGLVPFAAAHVLVHGLAPGGYLGVVASRGFQWRLIAFNWVSLAVGPRPLFPQGVGMEVVFPWLLPGIGGAALAIGAGRGRAVAANLIVAGTVCLYWLLYLSYPDIHAYGLWRYSNVHYFKWTLLFLAFWAFLLLRALILRGHRAAATAALLAAALLFCWRPVFVPDSKGSETTDTVQAAVPPGLSPMNRAVILPAHGTSFDLFFGRSKLRIGDQVFTNTFDFKLFPDGAAMLMLPLRVLPPGAASLTLAPGVSLPRASTWLAGTTDLQFGVPCFVTPRLSDCKPRPEALQPLPEP